LITVDTYLHFDQLRKPEQEGMDYVILHRTGSSGILVMAPHAGGIEPGTGDIADAVAAQDHAFYCFKGIKKQGNRVLHISSNRFDEPLAMQRATEANWIVTFHGCRDVEPVVWVGGLALQRGDRIIESLQAAGFPARRCDRPGLRGLAPRMFATGGGMRRVSSWKSVSGCAICCLPIFSGAASEVAPCSFIASSKRSRAAFRTRQSNRRNNETGYGSGARIGRPQSIVGRQSQKKRYALRRRVECVRQPSPNMFVRIPWTFVPIILSIRNCVVSRSTCSRDFAV
jgi:phage replication-related protein YjqB (UPF0714/DUF867 family)